MDNRIKCSNSDSLSYEINEKVELKPINDEDNIKACFEIKKENEENFIFKNNNIIFKKSDNNKYGIVYVNNEYYIKKSSHQIYKIHFKLKEDNKKLSFGLKITINEVNKDSNEIFYLLSTRIGILESNIYYELEPSCKELLKAETIIAIKIEPLKNILEYDVGGENLIKIEMIEKGKFIIPCIIFFEDSSLLIEFYYPLRENMKKK